MIYGLSVLRVCYGPLPIFICNIAGFLNGWALLFAAITVAMYTFTRFMLVCVWKGMRQMDDNLIVRIATIEAIALSLLFTVYKLKLQGQETIPVSFFYFGCASLLENTKFQLVINYLLKSISGLYWKSANPKICQSTISNISICPFILHSHYNWIDDCNTKEMSHWK